MNKYEKFALKRNLLSITAYSIVALLTIYLLVDLMKEVYGGGKPGIWFCIIVLLHLSLCFLMLAKLKNSDDWLDCIKKAEEETRNMYEGMPAEIEERIAYKVLLVLESEAFFIKGRKMFRVVTWMIKDDLKDPSASIPNFPKDKKRIYSFICPLNDLSNISPLSVIKLQSLSVGEEDHKNVWKIEELYSEF